MVAKSRGSTRFEAKHDCLLRKKISQKNQEKNTTDKWQLITRKINDIFDSM